MNEKKSEKSGHSRKRFRNEISAGDKGAPKEMSPIVDKPAIQYIVEEAARQELKIY